MLPIIIYFALAMLNLGIAASRHGKPRPDANYNFWMSLLSFLILTGLLWWGGFFNP